MSIRGSKPSARQEQRKRITAPHTGNNVKQKIRTMTRKNYLLIVAAAAAFASCANDEVIVNNQDEGEITGAPITFGSSNVSGQTRATLSGNDAASKLNNEFVVFGTKQTSGVAEQTPFLNTVVTYSAASAGTSESNTNNWEYVGVQKYDAAKVAPAITSDKQTVKYWDYSADSYTFTAFSGKDFLSANGAKVESAKNTSGNYVNGYTVTVPAAADLSKIYFSDQVKVEKSSSTDNKYGKPVVLTFRNFGSKIRVGFYETVPGYKVKIDKFYTDSRTTQSSPITTFNDMKTEATSFVAALQNVNSNASGGNTVSVSYYETGENKDQVKVNSGSTPNYQYTLTLGNNVIGKELGTSPSAAVYTDTDNDHYTYVYPNLENANPMLIRCDYTLTSDDGSGETIKVKNARVTVPTQYVQWKSNYAYTYLFKISDNTNGTTGNVPSDPDNPSGGDAEGLFPITFDAVVMEATDYAQETTTTVATNSVTSYAKDGYENGKDIYFVNNQTTGNHSVICPTAVGDNESGKVQVYSVNAGKSEADVLAYLNGSTQNGVTLTAATTTLTHEVPSADGTKLVFGEDADGKRGATKFTPSTAGNYVYVYCTTKYVAPTYVEATGYTTGAVYYDKTTVGVYYTASGIVDQASYTKYLSTTGHKLYTKTAGTGTAGVYDVKVITVE